MAKILDLQVGEIVICGETNYTFDSLARKVRLILGVEIDDRLCDVTCS